MTTDQSALTVRERLVIAEMFEWLQFQEERALRFVEYVGQKIPTRPERATSDDDWFAFLSKHYGPIMDHVGGWRDSVAGASWGDVATELRKVLEEVDDA